MSQPLEVPRYVPRFDGLRALAVGLVLLFHLEHPESTSSRPLFSAGWIGVDLFFVLSGFLITGILLDGKGARGQLKSFYARRVLRIFPLYYATLALVFFAVPALVDDADFAYAPSERPYYFLYVQNLFLRMFGEASGVALGHTWSLAIEEQFYLVWPWLVVLLPRRLLGWLLVLVIVASPLVRYGILVERPRSQDAYWLVYRHTLLHVDGLAVGCLGAVALRGFRPRRELVQRVSAGALVLGLPFAAWILYEVQARGIHHFPYTPTTPLTAALLYSCLAVGFGGVLGLALSVRSRTADLVLANPLVVYVGKISYGLYLIHFPVVVGLRQSVDSPLAALGLTLGLAVLSWHALERPFLQLKARFPSPAAERS